LTNGSAAVEITGLRKSYRKNLRAKPRPAVDQCCGLPQAMPAVGSLIEEPKFFRPFTGRRNLELLADVAGLSHTRVGEVLETVGLADRADERVKGYSPGMRQRGQRLLHAGPASLIVIAITGALVVVASVALSRRDVA
jgi:ABC-type Na+ transport system ATPase subunit NatA